MTLELRVIPNAKQTRFKGWRDGILQLQVAVPARDGMANKATVRHLADFFRVPRSSIRLVSGEKSRHKKIEIIGLDAVHAEKVLDVFRLESQFPKNV